jgi:ribonuclease J
MKAGNTLIAEIGDTVELTTKQMTRGEQFKAGSKYVDGNGIDGEDSFVLRDRIQLSEDGFLVVVVGLDEFTAELASLEIIAKGLSLSEEATAETKANIVNALKQLDLKKIKDEQQLSGLIRRNVRNYVQKATKKNPMILPIIMVI